MQVAPVPDDEEQRLALLAACNILYTPAEAAFDDVAQLAADLCSTEIALITLVDSDYQWFKARVGVEQVGTPRDLSFCAHCIVGRKPFVINDTHLDTRFADNPLVTGDPFLRFYAGVPLLVDGLGVGAISVADRAPRELGARQLAGLQRLAQQVSRELSLRRDLARASGTVKTGGAANELPVRPGDVVGGYRLERELGRGGAGVVFEAVAPDGVRVALKVLRPAWGTTHAQLERFAREARVLMRLTSPYVAQLYDVGNLDLDAGGLPFLVLELLQGADLADIVDGRGSVAPPDACTWIGAVCEAVADAHELGIVHRDLKPSNIFLSRGPDGFVPKILDFGIATTEHEVGAARITDHDIVLGSPGYMSPEQMMGATLDGRTDVWSMGVVLYELLTGKLPFPGNSPFEIFAAAQARPALPMSVHVAGIPTALQTLVSSCLRKKPEDRTLGMRELGRQLRAITPPS